jgi:hypothetical protein
MTRCAGSAICSLPTTARRWMTTDPHHTTARILTGCGPSARFAAPTRADVVASPALADGAYPRQLFAEVGRR